MIPDGTAEEIHSVICEESLEDHMDPEWPGRCVKAAQVVAPYLMAQALSDAADAIEEDPYDDLDPFYAGWLRDRARKMREAGGMNTPNEAGGCCRGCPDCQGIPGPRPCLGIAETGNPCILDIEHGGLHK